MENKAVIPRICELYNEEVEKKTRLLYHLAHSSGKENDLEMLGILLDSPKDFKDYCDEILKNITEEDDEQFALNNLKLAKYIDLSKTGADLEKWAEDNRGVLTGAGIGLTKFWCSLPPESQKQIIVYIGEWSAQYASIIPHVIPNSWSLLPRAFGPLSDALVGLGRRATYGLTAIYLTYEALRNIYKWYKGEISGKRVAKSIVDTTIAVAGGFAGASAGIAVGAMIGPVGAVVGGIAGGITGSITAEILSGILTTEIFSLPKEVAVENAYRYLRVHHKADVSVINSAYKNLCLMHHPDKGGSKEEFFKLQSHMAIIKVHRGEIYE